MDGPIVEDPTSFLSGQEEEDYPEDKKSDYEREEEEHAAQDDEQETQKQINQIFRSVNSQSDPRLQRLQKELTEQIEENPIGSSYPDDLLAQFAKAYANFAVEDWDPSSPPSHSQFKNRRRSPTKRRNIKSPYRRSHSYPSAKNKEKKEKPITKTVLQGLDLRKILRDAAVVMSAKRRSGKTCQIVALLIALAFPRIVLFGNGRDSSFWEQYIHKLYIFDTFDEAKFRSILAFQAFFLKLKKQPKFSHLNIDLAIILEDFSFDDKVMRSDVISDLVSNGRRMGIFFICSAQYFKSLKPKVRTNFDYYFFLREGNEDGRKVLYESVGGLFETREDFYNVLKACTNERRSLVIDLTTEDTSSIDKFCYHFKPPLYPPQKLGSFEYNMFAELYYLESDQTEDYQTVEALAKDSLGDNREEQEEEGAAKKGKEPKIVLGLTSHETVPTDIIQEQVNLPGVFEIHCIGGRKQQNVIALCETAN